jgi:hypothetical protein
MPVIVVFESVYVKTSGVAVVVSYCVVDESDCVVEGATVVDVDSVGSWSIKTLNTVSEPSNGCNKGQINVRGFANTLNPVYLK